MSDESDEEFIVPGKVELRAAMDEALAEFLAFLDGFSHEEMVTPTDAAGWTVRDRMTHCAAWAEGIAALLHREARWAAMGLDIDGYDDLDLDACNEQIAVDNRHLSPTQARAWLVDAHGRVAAAVDAMPEEELAAPYGRFVAPFPQDAEGVPVVAYIIGNTVEHYDEHRPWIAAIVESFDATKGESQK